MKKKLFFVGLFVIGVIGVGIFAYTQYGPVAAGQGGEAVTLPETGTIVDTVLSAPSLQPQKSEENGITVVVTPLLVSSEATTWKFDVVMSTHVQELGGYDLATLAVLIDGTGKSHAPIAWEPDAKEGHHIGGVLTFDQIDSDSGTVAVKIAGIGGEGERVFAWGL